MVVARPRDLLLSLTPVDVEFEPYDHDLAKRITSLHANIEALNLRLATTRREAVARAARAFEGDFTQGSAEVDAALARQDELCGRPVEEEQFTLGFEGRQEDVRRVWEDAIRGLGSLERGLPETVARADGAKRVVDYLEGR